MIDYTLHPKSLDVWVIIDELSYNLSGSGLMSMSARDKAVARGLLDHALARLDEMETIS